MTLTIHLFAHARELAGANRVAIDVPPGSTVADVRAALAASFPALASLLANSAIAVNHDFADATHVVGENDEIAVIPPVSGG